MINIRWLSIFMYLITVFFNWIANYLKNKEKIKEKIEEGKITNI